MNNLIILVVSLFFSINSGLGHAQTGSQPEISNYFDTDIEWIIYKQSGRNNNPKFQDEILIDKPEYDLSAKAQTNKGILNDIAQSKKSEIEEAFRSYEKCYAAPSRLNILRKSFDDFRKDYLLGIRRYRELNEQIESEYLKRAESFLDDKNFSLATKACVGFGLSRALKKIGVAELNSQALSPMKIYFLANESYNQYLDTNSFSGDKQLARPLHDFLDLYSEELGIIVRQSSKRTSPSDTNKIASFLNANLLQGVSVNAMIDTTVGSFLGDEYFIGYPSASYLDIVEYKPSNHEFVLREGNKINELTQLTNNQFATIRYYAPQASEERIYHFIVIDAAVKVRNLTNDKVKQYYVVQDNLIDLKQLISPFKLPFAKIGKGVNAIIHNFATEILDAHFKDTKNLKFGSRYLVSAENLEEHLVQVIAIEKKN